MTDEDKKTSIGVYKKTKQRLIKHGAMNDSFDEVINKLVDKIEGKNKT